MAYHQPMAHQPPLLPRRQLLALFGASTGLSLLVHACASDDGPGSALDGGSEPPERDASADAETAKDASANTDASDCRPTSSDLEGPYYEPGAPERTQIATASEPGERIIISGTVYGPDCKTPLENAIVDVWQADREGVYHGPEDEYRLRGRLYTDADGRYEFETTMPGRYAQSNGFRPAHIHFKVSHADGAPLTTQLYFMGDPYLPPNDACGSGCNSGAVDLVIGLEGAERKRGVFDVYLG
jgi:catechol 1,2-dioxygenase